ncbi:MAG: hypothetical protein ACRD0P_10985 [Stackebrandtia sp.]
MVKLTDNQVHALRHAARDGQVLVVADPRATWAARRGTVVTLHHRGLLEAVERMNYGGEGRPRMAVAEGRITPAGLTALIEYDYDAALASRKG